MNYDCFYKKHPNYSGDSVIPHPLPCEFAIAFFKERENGVFVDVGAHDGIAWSNTLIFEELFSWSGLCIEANPFLYEELGANRTSTCLNYAIDSSGTEQIFWNITGSASGIGGLEKGFKNDHAQRIEKELAAKPESVCEKILMTTKRLDSILMDHNISHIDYLSIDVEGNELGVLESLDFNSCDCSLISVESNDRKSIQDYLIKFGYRLSSKICADDFYVKL